MCSNASACWQSTATLLKEGVNFAADYYETKDKSAFRQRSLIPLSMPTWSDRHMEVGDPGMIGDGWTLAINDALLGSRSNRGW